MSNRIKITMYGSGPPAFEAWLERKGIDVEVWERDSDLAHLGRFWAGLRNAEIRESGAYRSTHGNGDTPELAVAALSNKLAGKRIALNALDRDERREFDAPNDFEAES